MMTTAKAILNSSFKLGVLGGGQLGKMLGLAACNWHLPLYVLDKARSFPAGLVTSHFTEGDFSDFDDVLNFGLDKDVVTIEIEHVNTDALLELEKRGVKIHPGPEALNIIKDKGKQKSFYTEHGLPTSRYEIYDGEAVVRQALSSGHLKYPFVQKSRTAGYDGRGVAIIGSDAELEEKLLPGACVIEEGVDIEKELAVIVARNEDGEVATFPAVEMEFNPVVNLVEFLSCPATIGKAVERDAYNLARSAIEAFDICGLLAVELFLTKDGRLLINEVAPRPHNSGHHTIDSCYTSQFEQHLRAILNLPLGSIRLKSPSIMVNLLGAEGHTGPAHYEGLAECLSIEGVKIHLYGKDITKPFRKMGHATVLADDLATARARAGRVRNTLRIVSR
jgi:5-(carboxyamino)imidazole ribonucleotide synthase